MTDPVRWVYDQHTKRWSGDGGAWVLYQVPDGEHVGEHALTDDRGVVSYHTSHDEARKFADQVKEIQGR